MSPPSIVDLATVLDKDDLTKAITAQTSLSAPAAGPIASTVLMLAEIQSLASRGESIPHPSFLPARLLLLPPAQTLPDEKVQEYLYDLAHTAQVAAEAQACSSILAGAGSESDDTGDAAFWLGEGQFEGRAEEVVRALGLRGWAENGKLARVDVPMGGSGSLAEKFNTHAAVLQERYCFRVNAPVTGGVVVFVLVGRVLGRGWGGLVGAGTWSDE